MRDPRTIGPYQPNRLPSIIDLVEGGMVPAAAPAMTQAAAPPPSVASRIVDAASGVARGVGNVVSALPPVNLFTALNDSLQSGREQNRLRAEAMRLANDEAAAALPARQELSRVLQQETDPRRRQALARSISGGAFRPFDDFDQSPAQLAAFESVMNMQEENVRQKAISEREARQAQADEASRRRLLELEASLTRETTRQRQGGELALEEGKRALGPAPAGISDIGTTQGRYLSQSQQFVVRRDAFENVQFAAKDDTGASDVTLLYNFIKLQDPNAVKEGEIELSKQTGSIPDRWITEFNRLKEGDILSPETRKSLIEQSNGIFRNSLRSQLDLERGFNEYAGRVGIRPEDVTLGGTLIPPQLRQLAAEPQAPAEGPKPERRTINGAQYEKVQGGWRLVK